MFFQIKKISVAPFLETLQHRAFPVSDFDSGGQRFKNVQKFCSKRGNLNCNGHRIQCDGDILKYLRCETSRHLRDTISFQQTARIRISDMYTATNELQESCFEFSEG
jgi:hypothetical protein